MRFKTNSNIFFNPHAKITFVSHEHVLGLMIYVIFEKKVIIKIVKKKLFKNNL